MEEGPIFTSTFSWYYRLSQVTVLGEYNVLALKYLVQFLLVLIYSIIRYRYVCPLSVLSPTHTLSS